MAYLPEQELEKLGIKFGRQVKISEKCSIHGVKNIWIGNNVRIDDFCVLTTGDKNGFLKIQNNVHIAIGVCLFAGAGITIGDFCTISAKATLYSASDDYSGEYLIGPCISEEFLKVDCRPIIMKDYSAIGAHALVLPGVTLGEGAVLGAIAMANKSLEPWNIYMGVPAQKLKKRKKGLLKKAEQMRLEWARNMK